MGIENLRCFRCQEYGHLERDCPQIMYAAEIENSRAPWCGKCDQRTRQLWLNRDGTSVQRCPDCHPLAGKRLAQHRRCPECRMLVYSWDNNPCGQHLSPAAPDRRLPIERIREIERSN